MYDLSVDTRHWRVNLSAFPYSTDTASEILQNIELREIFIPYWLS